LVFKSYFKKWLKIKMVSLAGQNNLIKFFISPLGEEIVEGAMGGGVAGLSQVDSDTTPQEIALKTTGAIAGGIGLGMAGRRIGASIGKKINPNPLKNQDGILASFGRLVGSESTIEGAKHQAQAVKSGIQEALVNETSAILMEQAIQNPNEFAARYGITLDQFQHIMPFVKKGRQAAAAAKIYETLPEKEKHKLVHRLKNSSYAIAENITTQYTADFMDDIIKLKANKPKLKEITIPGTNKSIADMFGSLLNPAPPITGEHIGRAIGRFAGDEIGILTGLGAASALTGPLGILSPKDIKIKELEQELQSKK
jgi:hypothetical protein